MANGRVELFDVETDEAKNLFVFDRSEPVNYGCGVFPLVKVTFFYDCAVDAVKDLFADFAYLGVGLMSLQVGLFAKFGLLLFLLLVPFQCLDKTFLYFIFSQSRKISSHFSKLSVILKCRRKNFAVTTSIVYLSSNRSLARTNQNARITWFIV